MSVMLVLTSPSGAPALTGYALKLARQRAQKLIILCCCAGDDESAGPSRGNDEETAAVVARTLTAWDATSVEVDTVGGENLKSTVLERVKAGQTTFLIVGMQGTESGRRLGEQLFNVTHFDTLLLAPGDSDPAAPGTILVPMEGAFAGNALRLALDMAGTESKVSPFLVGSDFGMDARAVARQELVGKLQAMGITVTDRLVPQVTTAGKAMDAIAAAIAHAGLAIIGTKSVGTLEKLKRLIAANHAGPMRAAIGLLRPGSAAADSAWARIKTRLHNPLPQMGPTERIQLFDRIYPNVGLNADFVVMMTLSTAIAAMGLLSNSTAVVIGAMLVAPLMTPLIGAGFGLIQGNYRLFTRAMRSMVLGILSGLALAVVIGLVVPKDEMTIELIVRSKPDVLDFFVALLSGAAAAYAYARPGLAGTLAGVAIAAALVPPLATVGISLAQGVAFVAVGAAVLHVTNLVAITLGAALTCRLLGVHGTRATMGPLFWTRRAVMLLSLASVCLVAFLVYQTAAKQTVGQVRPAYFPVSEQVYDAVQARIDQEPDVQLMMALRSGFIEEGNMVSLMLAADGPVSPDLRRDLRQLVKELLGEEAKIVVWIVRNASMDKD